MWVKTLPKCNLRNISVHDWTKHAATHACSPDILHKAALALFITDHVGSPAAANIRPEGAHIVPIKGYGMLACPGWALILAWSLLLCAQSALS